MGGAQSSNSPVFARATRQQGFAIEQHAGAGETIKADNTAFAKNAYTHLMSLPQTSPETGVLFIGGLQPGDLVELLMFGAVWSAGSYSDPNNNTANVDVWEIKDIGRAGVPEYVAKWVAQLAVTCGNIAVNASSERFNSNLKWIDTITVVDSAGQTTPAVTGKNGADAPVCAAIDNFGSIGLLLGFSGTATNFRVGVAWAQR